MGKLSALAIKEKAVPREKDWKLAGGAGLSLLAKAYWRLKYSIAGREKQPSLGIYPDVTLKEA